jgi:hypothetical protein
VAGLSIWFKKSAIDEAPNRFWSEVKPARGFFCLNSGNCANGIFVRAHALRVRMS